MKPRKPGQTAASTFWKDVQRDIKTLVKGGKKRKPKGGKKK